MTAFTWRRRAVLTGIAAVTAGWAMDAPAQAAMSSRATVESFHDALITVMKNAKTLGFKGRYDKLLPVVSSAFNLPFMTRVAIGQAWTQLSPTDQKRLVEAFTRFSVATYASRFDGYSGERFETTGEQTLDNKDKIVETKLVTSDDTVKLNYLTRPFNADDWQIIDVYLTGTISELAVRRSEFASLMRRSGPVALAESLEKRADEMGK